MPRQPSDGGPTPTHNIRFPVDVWAAICAIAARNGDPHRGKSKVVIDAVRRQYATEIMAQAARRQAGSRAQP